MSKAYKVTASRAMPGDIGQVRDFLYELEELVDDPLKTPDEIGAWMKRNWWRCAQHWRKILFGYETLIDNACDPTLTILEWKPEILKAFAIAKYDPETNPEAAVDAKKTDKEN